MTPTGGGFPSGSGGSRFVDRDYIFISEIHETIVIHLNDLSVLSLVPLSLRSLLGVAVTQYHIH